MRTRIQLARGWHWALVAAVVGLLWSGEARTAGGGQISADEYGVKAAFLYNLAKFVDWPPGKLAPADTPLVIGVAGEGAVERMRAVVKDKSIDKHRITVRLVETERDLEQCHILFVTRAEQGRESGLARAAQRVGVLTAGETDKFLEAGGMIRFYLEADNLRLEINEELVQQAGLTIKASALSTLVSKGIARLRKN